MQVGSHSQCLPTEHLRTTEMVSSRRGHSILGELEEDTVTQRAHEVCWYFDVVVMVMDRVLKLEGKKA